MKQLKITEMNKFMGKLLKSEAFDDFLLREGTVRTFMDFVYSGEFHGDYFDSGERDGLAAERYACWRDVKENVLGVIRGKHTPLLIQLSFLAGSELKKSIAGDNEKGEFSLSLGFTYKNGSASIVTGVYRSTFSLDKELDRKWDAGVESFLAKNDINYEEMV
ncbi:MAG: hypothetical protein IJS80_05525 [Lachnospiraceae bacterium]|nr:hypothetical protein [Lachnospiraceae bacterium]